MMIELCGKVYFLLYMTSLEHTPKREKLLRKPVNKLIYRKTTLNDGHQH